MQRERAITLFAILIGLLLQGAAWVLSDAPQDVRVLLTILSLLPIMLAIALQGIESQGVRARLSSLGTFLRINGSLVFLAFLSIGVLIVLGRAGNDSYLTEVAVSLATVLLAISLFTLIRGLGTQPSLRIV